MYGNGAGIGTAPIALRHRQIRRARLQERSVCYEAARSSTATTVVWPVGIASNRNSAPTSLGSVASRTNTVTPLHFLFAQNLFPIIHFSPANFCQICQRFFRFLTPAILILTPHLRPVTIQPLFPTHSTSTQRKDITMKNTKCAPASVASLLRKKLNKIHVLKCNEKKSKPAMPVVHTKRLTEFTVTDMAFLPDLS